MGGNLKKSQIISGHMADMFSQIYLGYAILYHKEKYGLCYYMYDICLSEINKEFYDSFDKLKYELPKHLYYLTQLSCRKPNFNRISVKDKYYFSNLIWRNDKVKEYIESQIYTNKNILGKIRNANLKRNDITKSNLIDDIISVGEFNVR